MEQRRLFQIVDATISSRPHLADFVSPPATAQAADGGATRWACGIAVGALTQRMSADRLSGFHLHQLDQVAARIVEDRYTDRSGIHRWSGPA
jgi:hypothetical protein